SAAMARLAKLREELKASIDADAEAFRAAMAAYKRSKDGAEDAGLIDAALQQAAAVPLAVAERAREVLGIADSLRPMTNPNMSSDLTTAAALARASVEGALANVQINIESIHDADFVAQVRERVRGLG